MRGYDKKIRHTRLDRVSMPSAAMDTRMRGYDKLGMTNTNLNRSGKAPKRSRL